VTQRYKMTVAYDGTHYAGWQVQPGERTIQSELERAAHQISGEIVRIHCSGRTDSGVHARAQVTHFDLDAPLETRRLARGLNALLDSDIRVTSLTGAAPDFDARRSATGKQYRYFLWDGAVLPPHVRLYRTHVLKRLELEAMQDAAGRLMGRNDFSAFAANPNREVPSTTRTLSQLQVSRKGHEVTIVAESEGFLYKMVRSLAGFLIRVGEGEVSPEAAGAILDSRERTARVPTAPPQGLFLWKVFY
jgi:tRNA pseudouridine38-40 synthase